MKIYKLTQHILEEMIHNHIIFLPNAVKNRRTMFIQHGIANASTLYCLELDE